MLKASKAALAAVVALYAYAQAPAWAGPEAVKIGVMGDQSGFAADVGGKGAVIAAQMAVEDFGGTVLGKPVQVLAADMQNKPEVASQLARRWFDIDKVDAIADLPVSSVALAVQEVAREKKKVALITEATTTDLTGKACSPWTIHWADDTSALSVGTAKALVQAGKKDWFFLTADFAFGHAMEKAATDVITANGGRVLGSVRHPMENADFSTFLLQAQASKAQVVGLANVGVDTITAIKQAGEFGLMQGGQSMAGMIVFDTDVNSLGLKVAQGLMVTSGFYWDSDDATRAFAKRFFQRHGKMPTKAQANTYAAVLHYLKSVAAAGSEDSDAVVAKMKSTPADYFGKPVTIRQDGRVLYELGLYEVKKPEESKYPWDFYKQVRRLGPEEAFKPMGGCPFLNQ